jgi:glycosyltransferase involved in cell wall biosynthesis
MTVLEATKRVLFISSGYPWPLDNGAVMRTFRLASALAAHHRVTMVALRRNGASGAAQSPLHTLCERFIVLDNGDVIDRAGGPYGLWRPLGQRLKDVVAPGLPAGVRRWWSNPLLEALIRLRKTDDYDIVWAERPAQAEVARRAGWRNVVVDLVDRDSEAVGRTLRHDGWYRSRSLHQLDWRRLRSYEASLPARFAHVVVCKQDDREFLNNHPNVSVVPNGVSARPPTDPEMSRAKEMLFVGTMGYEPNADAVKYFMRDVMPSIQGQQSDACLSVVGKEAESDIQQLHDGQACFVHGQVPDVTPYYQSAGLVVAPIRLGAGTRLKILEALMFGKALVASSVAVEGLDLRPGIDLEVADTPSRFVNACLELMRDESRRHRLGQAGRKRVLERYEWARIGSLANAVVAQTAQASSSTRAYESRHNGDTVHGRPVPQSSPARRKR